jgi:hypothetical protein
MIPEAVPLVQSVTTARPAVFTTPAGEFQYRNVKLSWFFGYRETEIAGGRALVATPEKALLDLFHLSRGEFTKERIEQLRLQDLERLDLETISRMSTERATPRVKRAARRLLELVARERASTRDL